MYDHNVSLLEAASSPSNVFDEALNGNAIAMGIISSSLIILISYESEIDLSTCAIGLARIQ